MLVVPCLGKIMRTPSIGIQDGLLHNDITAELSWNP